MEDHGGEITVESKEGVGTRVRLYLPVERAEQPLVVAANTKASAN